MKHVLGFLPSPVLKMILLVINHSTCIVSLFDAFSCSIQPADSLHISSQNYLTFSWAACWHKNHGLWMGNDEGTHFLRIMYQCVIICGPVTQVLWYCRCATRGNLLVLVREHIQCKAKFLLATTINGSISPSCMTHVTNIVHVLNVIHMFLLNPLSSYPCSPSQTNIQKRSDKQNLMNRGSCLEQAQIVTSINRWLESNPCTKYTTIKTVKIVMSFSCGLNVETLHSTRDILFEAKE